MEWAVFQLQNISDILSTSLPIFLSKIKEAQSIINICASFLKINLTASS